uniref:Putative product n=1 Tax=Xenopsylla cheopis TaxID=163159 RepID=A0A6M2DQV3_XENCH
MGETLGNVLVERESESHVSVHFGSNCVYVLIGHNTSVHFETVLVQRDSNKKATRLRELLLEALYVENGIVIIKIDANKKLSVWSKTSTSELLNFVMEQQLWTGDDMSDHQMNAREQRSVERNHETFFHNAFFPKAIRFPAQ